MQVLKIKNVVAFDFEYNCIKKWCYASGGYNWG